MVEDNQRKNKQPQKSREHHWWPVGLQKYWANAEGNIGILSPDGTIKKKKPKNRKIAKKAHGHTISKGSIWETNFEPEFDPDKTVDEVVRQVQVQNTIGPIHSYLWKMLKRVISSVFLRRRIEQSEVCEFGALTEKQAIAFVEFVLLVLLRLPRSRFILENYSVFDDPESREEVGKHNMLTRVTELKRTLKQQYNKNIYFVFLHTIRKEFVFGDGIYDTLSHSCAMGRLSGHAIFPLTPSLAVYICTPRRTKSAYNYASLIVADWIVDEVNQLTQIYSKKEIFFSQKIPKISNDYTIGEFRHISDGTPEVRLLFDHITGYGSEFRSENGQIVQRTWF